MTCPKMISIITAKDHHLQIHRTNYNSWYIEKLRAVLETRIRIAKNIAKLMLEFTFKKGCGYLFRGKLSLKIQVSHMCTTRFLSAVVI